MSTQTRKPLTYENLGALVEQLRPTEEEAATLSSILAERFGWAGSAFTTEDIRSSIEGWLDGSMYKETEPNEEQIQEMVDYVKSDLCWTDSIGERTSEKGFEILDTITQEAIEAILGVEVQ